MYRSNIEELYSYITDQRCRVTAMNLGCGMENLAFAHRSREELRRVSDDVLK